jgi:flagellin-like hook-associated protein FlgL
LLKQTIHNFKEEKIMVVQHNMQAMNANRLLNVTTGAQQKSTEKLSSGYKINRAADDAAGLSISEKMRRQIRGLDRASSNAQDGISSVQTAEGALTEVHDMLQRMNELANQASNGTNSTTDREAIQSEIDQLTTEIDRVSETTKFNELYLMKGDAGTKKINLAAHDAGLKGSLSDQGETATFTATLTTDSDYSIAGKTYHIYDEKDTVETFQSKIDDAETVMINGTSYKKDPTVTTATPAEIADKRNSATAMLMKASELNNSAAALNTSANTLAASATGLQASVDAKTASAENKSLSADLRAVSVSTKKTSASNKLASSKMKGLSAAKKAASATTYEASATRKMASADKLSSIGDKAAASAAKLYASAALLSGTQATQKKTAADSTLKAASTNYSKATAATSVAGAMASVGAGLRASANTLTTSSSKLGQSANTLKASATTLTGSINLLKTSAEDLKTSAEMLANSVTSKKASAETKAGSADAKTASAETAKDISDQLNKTAEFMASSADGDPTFVSNGRQYRGSELKAMIVDGAKVGINGTQARTAVDLVNNKDNKSLSEVKEMIGDALLQANQVGVDDETAVEIGTPSQAGDEFTYDITKGSVEVARSMKFDLHVGADADMTNKIGVNIEAMNSKYLGVQGLQVVDADGTMATYAIDAIEDAITKVNEQRSALGAVQNRLEHTINNLDNVVENTQSAESQIRDTDIADEMVRYSKNNILSQAGQSMLAQANQSTQGALSLLG